MKSFLMTIVILATSFLAQANDHRIDGSLDFYTNGAPTESFRQTCQVIKENRNRIQAYCRTWEGEMIYNDFVRRGCTTDIANVDGNLVCSGQKGQLPTGSYQRSCKQCVVDGRTLSCQCMDMQGRYQFTSINFRRCGPEITNMNGQLVCQ